MRFLWCSLILFGLVCGGCSKKPSVDTTKNSDNKKPRTSENYRAAPGPASAQRRAFNEAGNKSLGDSSVDKLFIEQLDDSDLGKVKGAIVELQNKKVKSALPKLESMAKNHQNADIKRRAQAAVDYIKK